MAAKTLPDLPCRPGGVLLVGINPAPVSVRAGHYYQGALGQRIWGRLERAKLLDRSAADWEDDAFVAAGNGLTDLVKTPTRSAGELGARQRAAGREALAAKIREGRPGLLLFAFEPPARALHGRKVAPGRGPVYEGVPTFRMAGPTRAPLTSKATSRRYGGSASGCGSGEARQRARRKSCSQRKSQVIASPR
jgi:double-stranded uracil-DNA glycosylase